jgi:hypothetical protein
VTVPQLKYALPSISHVISFGEGGGDTMIRKEVLFAVLTTFCLCALLFAVTPIRSAIPYDPWSDTFDENGKIDMKDIGYMASQFMTSGDPTKNVTVTNWPKTQSVLVWYIYSLNDGAYVYSPTYYSDGYSTLHVLVNVAGLVGAENLDFIIWAPLWNSTPSYQPVPAYERLINSTSWRLSISMDVPWEEFYFSFIAAANTTSTVSLRYWLTWA